MGSSVADIASKYDSNSAMMLDMSLSLSISSLYRSSSMVMGVFYIVILAYASLSTKVPSFSLMKSLKVIFDTK